MKFVVLDLFTRPENLHNVRRSLTGYKNKFKGCGNLFLKKLRGTKISGQSCEGSKDFRVKSENDSNGVSGLKNDQPLTNIWARVRI